MKTALLIMAAGIGSRFGGGIKQLEPVGLHDEIIVGLNEIDTALPDVDENGRTPLENARFKALAYYAALKRPVFACDSELYIDGLPEGKQPGIHVRMVDGKHLSDDEMVEHYSGIAKQLDGKAVA